MLPAGNEPVLGHFPDLQVAVANHPIDLQIDGSQIAGIGAGNGQRDWLALRVDGRRATDEDRDGDA
jgi:hypothetical protein